MRLPFAKRLLVLLLLPATVTAQQGSGFEGEGWELRRLDVEVEVDPGARKLEVSG